MPELDDGAGPFLLQSSCMHATVTHTAVQQEDTASSSRNMRVTARW